MQSHQHECLHNVNTGERTRERGNPCEARQSTISNETESASHHGDQPTAFERTPLNKFVEPYHLTKFKNITTISTHAKPTIVSHGNLTESRRKRTNSVADESLGQRIIGITQAVHGKRTNRHGRNRHPPKQLISPNKIAVQECARCTPISAEHAFPINQLMCIVTDVTHSSGSKMHFKFRRSVKKRTQPQSRYSEVSWYTAAHPNCEPLKLRLKKANGLWDIFSSATPLLNSATFPCVERRPQ